MMKNILKVLLTAAVIMLAAVALTITACAEDYVFDISEPMQTSGEWDLAFIYETANAGNFPDNFDTACMTPDSEVIVEYTYEGKCSKAPLELIWQTWKGPVEPDPDVKKNWNKVAPYEYNETTAKFSFKDIASAYGTENFSTVYAINIGDKGVKLTVTGVTITNCKLNGSAAVSAETESEAQTGTEAETETDTEKVTQSEPQAEKETVRETSAPVTEASAAAETAVTESEPEKDSGGAMAVIVVVIIFVIMAAVMAAAYLSKKKKRKSRYY